jgi:hypothetical protein
MSRGYCERQAAVRSAAAAAIVSHESARTRMRTRIASSGASAACSKHCSAYADNTRLDLRSWESNALSRFLFHLGRLAEYRHLPIQMYIKGELDKVGAYETRSKT